MRVMTAAFYTNPVDPLINGSARYVFMLSRFNPSLDSIEVAHAPLASPKCSRRIRRPNVSSILTVGVNFVVSNIKKTINSVL